MDEILESFLEEGAELVEMASECLLQLERAPTQSELLQHVFRAFHTLKGSSALFDLFAMTRVMHVGEDVLASVRAGHQPLTGEMVDALLAGLDQVGRWIGELQRGGVLPEPEHPDVVALATRLTGLLHQPPEEVALPEPTPGVRLREELPPWLEQEDGFPAFVGRGLVGVEYLPEPHALQDSEDPLARAQKLPSLLHLDVAPRADGADPSAEPSVYTEGIRAVAACGVETLRQVFEPVEDRCTFYLFDRPFGAELAPAVQQLQALADALAEDPDPEDPDVRREAHGELAERVIQGAGFPLTWVDRFRRRREVARAQRSDASLRTGILAILDQVDAAQRVGVRLSMCPAPDDGASERPASRAPSEAAAPAPVPESPARARASEPAEGAAPTTVGHVYKVRQERIDALLELAGQLLVATNSLPHMARRAEMLGAVPQLAREIEAHTSVLTGIADGLHQAVTALRIVTVSQVFSRLPRLVRDLDRKLGKDVRLEILGEATEADKNTVERLADPLIHLVRNCMDHGFETPEERVAAGKPRQGRLRVFARPLGDALVVTVADDGRGIDPAKMRTAALRQGIVTEEEAHQLSDREAVALAFHAGLSTAAAVSEVSGRGVGMDVVRTSIEARGGSVEVNSELGKGTSVTITLPLSMVATRVLRVEVDGRTLGIPVEMVRETGTVASSDVALTGPEPMVTLGDRVVPAVWLGDLLPRSTSTQAELGFKPLLDDQHAQRKLVLMDTAAGEVGVVVDGCNDVVDVMLKPLEGAVPSLRGYLGTSLLEDGRALLVLDLAELLQAVPARSDEGVSGADPL